MPLPRPPARKGAVHSAEIEYALGNLATNKVYAWTPDDYQGIENHAELLRQLHQNRQPQRRRPAHVAAPDAGAAGQMLRIDVNTRVEPDQTRARYLFLEQK